MIKKRRVQFNNSHFWKFQSNVNGWFWFIALIEWIAYIQELEIVLIDFIDVQINL